MTLENRSVQTEQRRGLRASARAIARARVEKIGRLFLALSILTFVMFWAAAALAQDPPTNMSEVPSSAQGVGSIPHYVPSDRGGTLPAIEVPSARSTVPPGADELVLTPTQINVTGATAFSGRDIAELTSGYIGHEVTLSELYSLATQIQTAYRERGYLLTRALVPAQRIEDGIFRIEVIEGFIEDVFVVGDIGPAKWQVEQYVENLLHMTPVRTRDIERYLLLANDLPGIQAVAVIRPGTTGPGAAQLVVEVERDPFDGYMSINNRGSQYAGPWSGALSVGANGFAPFGDRTELIYYRALDSRESTWSTGVNGTDGQPPEQIFGEIPMEQWYGQLSYEGHILDEGLRLLLSATQTLSHPGYSLAQYNMKTRSDRYEAVLSYPVIRTRSHSLYTNLSLSHSMVRSSAVGNIIGRDRLTVLEAGMHVDFQDVVTNFLPFDFLGASDSRISLSVRQGVPWFGASSDNQSLRSRIDGTSQFTTVQGRFQRTQAMFSRFDFFFAAKGQYSFNTLLSSEEFRVGGDEFGRGYDPSEIAGEHGYGLTTEFRYQDRPDWFILTAYEAYVFLDYGSVWNEDVGFAPHDDLASTGFGVRTEVGEDAYLDLEYAHPLTLHIGSRDDEHRWLMRATVQF